MNPTGDPTAQSTADRQLRLLAIAHYGLAAITAFKAVLGLPLLFPGLTLMNVDPNQPAPPPPAWFVEALEWTADVLGNQDLRMLSQESVGVGVLLVATAASIIAVSLVHGVALAYVGRLIAKRQGRLTVLIFSWLDIVYLPFGTVLSIFAIKILANAEVKRQYPR